MDVSPSNHVYPSLAERIKQLRHEKGLSGEELAEKVGVAKSTFYSWQAGATPPIEKVYALAEAFGLRVGEFLDPEPSRFCPTCGQERKGEAEVVFDDINEYEVPTVKCQRCQDSGIVYWAPAHSAPCPDCSPSAPKWSPHPDTQTGNDVSKHGY